MRQRVCSRSFTRRPKHDFCGTDCHKAYQRQQSLGNVTRDELIKLYWEGELPLHAIAEKFGKGTMTVHRWFEWLEIPCRSKDEGRLLATTSPEFAELKRQQTSQLWKDGVFGSEEYRQKISDANKGKPHPWAREMCKRLWADGTFGGEEWTRKQSLSKRGEKCWRWRGGTINYRGPNWQEQRRKARQRDNYTCQDCGITEASLGKDLSVHHKRPYYEFNGDWKTANELNNLISLCPSCHMKAEHVIERELYPR